MYLEIKFVFSLILELEKICFQDHLKCLTKTITELIAKKNTIFCFIYYFIKNVIFLT